MIVDTPVKKGKRSGFEKKDKTEEKSKREEKEIQAIWWNV